MGLPTKPTLDYSYTAFQQSQGDNAFPGTEIDNDHDNLKLSIDETIDFLTGSFRSDGVLKASAYPGASDLNEYVDTATVAATDAAASAVDAAASASSAASSLDQFMDLYLGAKSTDPTLDNDGNALQDGATYWNTSAKVLRIYDLGTTTWANGVQTSGITTDTFVGDGVEVDFTLSVAPTTIGNTQVYVGGVYQEKAEYSVAGSTLTFNTAPPNGVGVQVMTFEQIAINVPADGSVTAAKLANGAIEAKLGYTPASANVSRSGIASPSIRTLLAKLSDVADIRDWDAVDLTGANDEASIVQAAVDETADLTNPVPVRYPGCKIALGTPITTKNGTVFEGPMKGGGSYDTKAAWFHIAHTGVGFTNLDNLGAQRFSRINTYRTQPTPGGGAYTPTAHGFDFDFVGAQDITMEDVCLLNPTKAIQVRGNTVTGAASGRMNFRNITGQPLQEGFRLAHCLDCVYMDEVHWWPLWNGVNAQLAAYIKQNASAFILGRVDNAKWGRVFSYGYYRAMLAIQTAASGSLPAGTVGLFSCQTFGADDCSSALIVNSGTDGAVLNFGNFYAASNPTPLLSAENFIWTLGDNARVNIGNLHGQYTSGALIGLNGTGNVVTAETSSSTAITGTEFVAEAGNTIRLGKSPKTSASTIYGGAGVIETPDWRSFTPTITSGTGAITAIGANAARYRRQGKSVKANGRFVITTNGTGGTDLRISNLPFTVISTGSIDPCGSGRKDNTGPMLQTIASNGGTLLRIGLYDNTYPGSDGAVIDWNIEYEAA